MALTDSGATHYSALALFWVLGIRVAVNLHNVLWRTGFAPMNGGTLASRTVVLQ
jgi:hypothetical protein